MTRTYSANPPPAELKPCGDTGALVCASTLGKSAMPAEVANHARNVVMKGHTVAYFCNVNFGDAGEWTMRLVLPPPILTIVPAVSCP